jgi:hypothetical protein
MAVNLLARFLSSFLHSFRPHVFLSISSFVRSASISSVSTVSLEERRAIREEEEEEEEEEGTREGPLGG